ncbi:hypothetical protein PHYPSEUDO_005185 [Phytophthora pseudosyringae]|uniref:RxLR effector protein n=1 Tax=Phytophthora pseudosyringae TaxID=221518 RepID=A0A8T1VPR9_9STRA|nr:hypothetical protein PHYPSEUDO_005185 [Phytophthora pseudosyringae]
MRFFYILLVAAAVHLATGSVLRAQTGFRSLRLSKTVDDAHDEERAKFDFNLLNDIFHALPEQFQRMRTQPSYLDHIFGSWKSGWIGVDEAVAFMKREGLSDKAIKQFKAAYKEYLKANRRH